MDSASKDAIRSEGGEDRGLDYGNADNAFEGKHFSANFSCLYSAKIASNTACKAYDSSNRDGRGHRLDDLERQSGVTEPVSQRAPGSREDPFEEIDD